MEDSFDIGDKVVKVGGASFVGEVRGHVFTIKGAKRYVVEATHPDYAGTLHIMSGRDLGRPTKETRVPDPLPSKVMGEETLNSANSRGAEEINRAISDKFGGIIG